MVNGRIVIFLFVQGKISFICLFIVLEMTTSSSGEPDTWVAKHQEMLPGNANAYPTSGDVWFTAQTLESASKGSSSESTTFFTVHDN